MQKEDVQVLQITADDDCCPLSVVVHPQLLPVN